ncbi:MAG: succinate dehydrogenase cytochrome b subunit [Planctomycetota bacterium]
MNIASIFKKVVMAITGLLLVGFLVSHLAGNQFIYFGDHAFNSYAEFLENNPEIVYPAETGLLLIFIAHLVMAFKLTRENSAARVKANEVRETAGQSTLSSRTMIVTGVIILAFVIMHVWQFKFGDKSQAGGLWGLVVIKTFQDPMFCAIYVVAMLALGFHLAHGIGSAFQSLGLFSQRRMTVRRIGQAMGWILALGFMALPLYAILAKPKVSDSKPIIVIPSIKADMAEKK